MEHSFSYQMSSKLLKRGGRYYGINFGPSAFLLPYHFGVVLCLRDNDIQFRHAVGVSGGVMGALALLYGANLELGIRQCFDLAVEPFFRLGSFCAFIRGYRSYFRCFRNSRASMDVGTIEQLQGRLHIAMRRAPMGKVHLVSDWQSEQELEDALMCSGSIPLVLHWWPNFFRNRWYIDPGLRGWGWPDEKLPEGDARADGQIRVMVIPYHAAHTLADHEVLIEPMQDAVHSATGLRVLLGIAGDVEMMMMSFVEGYRACEQCVEVDSITDTQSLHERFQQIVREQRGWKNDTNYTQLVSTWMMMPKVGDSVYAVLAISFAWIAISRCGTLWIGGATLLATLLPIFIATFWWPAHQHKKAYTRLPHPARACDGDAKAVPRRPGRTAS